MSAPLSKPAQLRIEIDFGAIWSKIKLLAGRFRIEHFLLLYFAAHVFQMSFPSDGGMVFDEAHYVPASLLTLAGQGVNLEHPPLGKIIGAAGIALFGNNWFAWRFPQVLISTVGLYFFYLVAKRFLGDPWALGATMLLAFDTIFFIHGGILLLDGPAFTLTFLTLELYFRKRYWWSAVSMGLAFFQREFVVLTFVTLIAFHVAVNRGALKQAAKFVARYTLIALLVLGILLWAYDGTVHPAQATTTINNISANVVLNGSGQPITTILRTIQSTSQDIMWNPVQNVIFMLKYHGPSGIVLNEATVHAYEHPVNWILPIDPFDQVTYYRVDVKVTTGNVTKNYVPIWYRAQPNLPLWYGIWPAAVGLALALIRRKEWDTAFFLAMGIGTNYLPWVVLDMLVRRIGFNYWMLNALPFISLGLVFAIKMYASRPKMVLALFVVAELAFFIWFFPVRPIGIGS